MYMNRSSLAGGSSADNGGGLASGGSVDDGSGLAVYIHVCVYQQCIRMCIYVYISNAICVYMCVYKQ